MQELKSWFDLNKKTLLKLFLGLGACILLFWFFSPYPQIRNVLKFIGNMFSPFAVGATIAFVLNVPMRAVEGSLLKKIKHVKVRRLLALLITFVAVLLVVALVFVLLIPAIVDTIREFWNQLQFKYDEAQVWAAKFFQDNPSAIEWINSRISELENINWDSIVKRVMSGFTSILNGTVSAISITVGFVFDLIISVVFAVYCLFQKETLAGQGRRLMYAFLPEKVSDEIVRILRISNAAFSNFLSGQCIEVCILGCMIAIGMAVFKMPYIPLVSVLAALTAFIPMVGAFVGCAIGAVLILVKDPVTAVIFVGMFVVIQQIEGNLIYPRVVGNSIGLSGMWVLLAVGVGGELFGVIGMFLMIPFASVLYTLLQEATRKRLSKSSVPTDKLVAQPPELRSRLKENREAIKKKKTKKSKETETNKNSETK